VPSPCDPPKFDEQDWSQFDFSRWHLDGLQLDSVAQAIADLTQRLTNSPEWQDNVKATVADLQDVMLNVYQEDSKRLEEEKSTVGKAFDQRMTAAKDRSANLAKTKEAAGAPLVIPGNAGTYQLAVKVTASDGHLGLSGMIVRLLDPRDRKTPLFTAVTDPDGNAFFAVPEQGAKEFDNQHIAAQVVTPGGKVVQETADAACIRLGQTETRVFQLEDSKDIQPNKAASLEVRARREIEVRIAAAKVDVLKQERESRLHTLDCRLQQNQAIIDSLQSSGMPSDKAGTPSSGPQASTSESPSPETPPSPKASSRTQGRRRRKS